MKTPEEIIAEIAWAAAQLKDWDTWSLRHRKARLMLIANGLDGLTDAWEADARMVRAMQEKRESQEVPA